MLVTRIRQLPHKPFCLPTQSHFHRPPPHNLHSFPANEPPNLHTQNHATSNKPSCTLNRPHPSTSTSPPSLHRTIKKTMAAKKHEIPSRHNITVRQALWNLIRKACNGPKKHEISWGYHVRKLCSKKHTYSISPLLPNSLSCIPLHHHHHATNLNSRPNPRTTRAWVHISSS
jgi:hypothetical protein